MKTMFSDMVAFLNSYNEIVERQRRLAIIKKPKEIEPFIARKPLQTIEVPKDDIVEEAHNLYHRLQQGLYTGESSDESSRSRKRPPKKKVDKSYVQNNKETSGYRIRRLGQPTLIVGPNGECPKLRPVEDKHVTSADKTTNQRSPNENEDIPDAKTLIQQLKTL